MSPRHNNATLGANTNFVTMAPIIRNDNFEFCERSPEELTGDEVVISGISGQFPNSANMLEFMENLYGKKEMADSYWPDVIHPELPKCRGKVNNWEYFDAQFFRVSYSQVKTLNPAVRLLLENTYGAIFDAGINPITLKNSKIAVMVGATYMDYTMKLYESKNANNFIVSGCSQTMIPNRISYWLDAKGPSYALDSGCTNSMSSLEQAYNLIKSGLCDAAIVGGYNYSINPIATINLRRHGLLCLDGKTNCFNKNGAGYVRSDVATILFLQKARDAKRIYSEVRHVKGKYFPDPDGNFLYGRDPKQIEEFLEEFYSEIKVSPDDVDFVEANAVGIAKSDSQELEAISNFFGRSKSIKVGSIKSNLGHTYSGSGICSIMKMCLAYQKGEVAGNLCYNEHEQMFAENVNILTDHTKLKRGSYAGINNFSYTGTNYHVLLKDHYKPKAVIHEKWSVPYLVFISGRNEDNVTAMLDGLENNAIDVEHVALIRNIFQYNIPGHTGRGYIILDAHHSKGTPVLDRHVEYYPGDNRPIWFLYSGMGSQWLGMGSSLMKIPTFARSIERCQNVLNQFNINLYKIIIDLDKSILDNILNCFVGIAAIQIGLTDVLKEIGIIPDNVIGHSVGELGCAYADGCLTTEETLLSAYYRGLVSIQTKFIKGSMAAIGLGYNEILKMCPPEIEVACHNSANSSTISGPFEKIKEFVAELTNLGIFAREVRSADIAYHSTFIKTAGPDLLKYMQKVILNPKKRSKKWLCTSVTSDKWDSTIYADADYFTNNLLNPVYFEETARVIPDNALIIEIAPHGLLQAIVKRSHPNCYHVPLTRRGETDSVVFLLKAIGKIYEAGLNPDIRPMYPEVSFPVSTETPLLSHMIGWEHSEKWDTFAYNPRKRVTSPGRPIILTIHDDDFKYVENYMHYGVSNVPAAAILVYVWETLAMYNNTCYKKMPVVFQNVQFYSTLESVNDTPFKLNIEILKGNQQFEVTAYDNNMVIASGNISSPEKNYSEIPATEEIERRPSTDEFWINDEDLYKMMNSKGYTYKGKFQSIRKINMKLNKAYIQWSDDWVTFLDGIIQLNLMSNDNNGVCTPNLINYLSIDIIKPNNSEKVDIGGNIHYFAELEQELHGKTVCGGVTMDCITFFEKQIPIYKYNLINQIKGNLQFGADFYKANEVKEQQIKLFNECAGDFDKLFWAQEDHMEIMSSVKVCFAGISLQDCSKAAGQIFDKHDYYGMDYSGVDKNGNRIMGVVSNGALSKYIVADEDLLWPVPDHWSLEEAATVPLPYLHAYYCLTLKCQLMPGDVVLVTGGASALGQAVISVCLALDCKVYTTVSDLGKKSFLLKMFPKLEENNIHYSRHDAFSNLKTSCTLQQGCNIVINCADGKIREAAIKCLGNCGIFLDIAEYDIKNNGQFNMGALYIGKNYKTVRLHTLFENNNTYEKKQLQERISDGIARGIVKPLSRILYEPTAVTRAFKLLSSSGHRGRVLIDMTKIDSTESKLNTIKRINVSSNNVQILSFNDSDRAIEHVEYFIGRGITKFVIFIQPCVLTSYLETKISIWKEKGIYIHIILEDKQNNSIYDDLFKIALNIGDIQDIYVYLDEYLDKEVALETVKTVRLLHLASTKLEHLRYFVLISTHNNCNKIEFPEIEEICAERNGLGLHALHVNIEKQTSSMAYVTNFRALEHSISSNLKSVTIQIKETEKALSTYLQRIYSVFGVTNITEIDESKSLDHFKITNIHLEQIKLIIKEFLNIDFSHNALKCMTIGSLRNLCMKENSELSKITDGLSIFCNQICHDHYIASEPIVPMKSVLSPQIVIEEDFDPDATYLLMIPGLEGYSQIFETMAERLKIQALTLQLAPDYKNNSIEEIASNIFQYLKNKVSIKSKFYILGYSFGVLVALELAYILEKEGIVGVVFCLDSSPEAMKVQLDAYVGRLPKHELENAIIMHLYKVLIKSSSEDLKLSLTHVEDWQKKIQLFVQYAMRKVSISHQYLGCCLDSVYKRILLAYDYNPTFKLNSELILIKGNPHPKAKLISKDFGLSQYSSNPIKVFHIDSDHAMIPYNIRVTNIINKTLKSTLQSENLKDQCNFYYKKVE